MPTDEQDLFWPEWEELRRERWGKLHAFARALGMNEFQSQEYADSQIYDAMPPCLAGG